MLFIFMHVFTETFISSTDSDHYLVASELTKALIDTYKVVAFRHMDHRDLYLINVNAICHHFFEMILRPLDEWNWCLAKQVWTTLIQLWFCDPKRLHLSVKDRKSCWRNTAWGPGRRETVYWADVTLRSWEHLIKIGWLKWAGSISLIFTQCLLICWRLLIFLFFDLNFSILYHFIESLSLWLTRCRYCSFDDTAWLWGLIFLEVFGNSLEITYWRISFVRFIVYALFWILKVRSSKYQGFSWPWWSHILLQGLCCWTWLFKWGITRLLSNNILVLNKFE